MTWHTYLLRLHCWSRISPLIVYDCFTDLQTVCEVCSVWSSNWLYCTCLNSDMCTY